MTQQHPNQKVTQRAKAGRDAYQNVGGNQKSNNNFSISIPLALLLATGGIAGALVFGMNYGGQTPQLEQPQSP